MNIAKINEYFLKSRDLNRNVDKCDRKSTFKGEISCDNPIADLTIGITFDLLGNIEEFRTDLRFANRYLCAFVSRAAEILPGMNSYSLSSTKITAQILKSFGLEGKETKEVEALRALLVGIS